MSPTNENHQAGPLPRLVLVPGHFLVGQQRLRLSSCRDLCFLRATQPLSAAQPEASPKTSWCGGGVGVGERVRLLWSWGSPNKDLRQLAGHGGRAGCLAAQAPTLDGQLGNVLI